MITLLTKLYNDKQIVAIKIKFFFHIFSNIYTYAYAFDFLICTKIQVQIEYPVMKGNSLQTNITELEGNFGIIPKFDLRIHCIEISSNLYISSNLIG